MQYPIILFDGVCNLCNSTVQFVLKRDPEGIFFFAPLQSQIGQDLIAAFGKSGTLPDSFVLITDSEHLYIESEAALRVAQRLGLPWSLLGGFLIVPSFIRDGVYRFIARNRYRWFGRTDTCMMPKPAWRDRFLQ